MNISIAVCKNRLQANSYYFENRAFDDKIVILKKSFRKNKKTVIFFSVMEK